MSQMTAQPKATPPDVQQAAATPLQWRMHGVVSPDRRWAGRVAVLTSRVLRSELNLAPRRRRIARVHAILRRQCGPLSSRK